MPNTRLQGCSLPVCPPYECLHVFAGSRQKSDSTTDGSGAQPGVTAPRGRGVCRVSRSPLSLAACRNHSRMPGILTQYKGLLQAARFMKASLVMICTSAHQFLSLSTNTSCFVSDGLGSQKSSHLLWMTGGTGAFPGLPLRQSWDVPLAYNCTNNHESIPVFRSLYAIYSLCHA